jgi:hypothetical protein
MLECELAMNRAITAMLLALTLAASATASPPHHDDLGLSYRVISVNPLSVEITLRPKGLFDSVAVEAASGVESLAPACAFSAVTEGGTYSCRFEVTGNSGDAAVTVNVAAQLLPSAGAQPLLEIHHLTFRNPAYLRPSPRPSSKHALSSTMAR